LLSSSSSLLLPLKQLLLLRVLLRLSVHAPARGGLEAGKGPGFVVCFHHHSSSDQDNQHDEYASPAEVAARCFASPRRHRHGFS
jgi:hypothetical protein